jgi:L-seryl-tRNA(Ser) seleniumtransferase
MLGGPQCGIIAGKKKYIDIMKKNQLLRALRVDKTCLAALEATLLHYLDEKEAIEAIPTLHMILSPAELHKKRAVRLKRKLSTKGSNFSIEIKSDFSLIGGGAMPGEKIESYVLSIRHKGLKASSIEKLLRSYEKAIIVRVNNDEVLMDLRTIRDEDFEDIVKGFCYIEENIK